MDNLYNFIMNKIFNGSLINSIITIVFSIILYKVVIYFLDLSESRAKLFTSKKSKTYIKLLKGAIRSIFLIVTALIILQINGVNVNSILAGVGVAGIIVGFAIQDWLKDIIRGSSIVSDEYFQIGDIVKYEDIEGKVITIGLKTTKIQELKTKNIISIANRNIEEIEVVSKFVLVNVPIPYELNVKESSKVIDDIVKLIKKCDNIHECKNLGVTELSPSYIEYLLEIECNQNFKLQVRRDALKSILLGLEKHNIKVPYTQIDIHNKN